MVRRHHTLWWLAFVGAFAGVGALAAGSAWAPFLVVLSGVTLANLAWTRPAGDRARDLPWWTWPLGVGGGVVATVGALPGGLPDVARLALVLVGFQVLLGLAGVRLQERIGAGRSLFAMLGHATLLLGAVLIVRQGPLENAVMACAGGFAVLLLHAYWSQQQRGGPGEEWEAVFLFALVAGLVLPFAVETFLAFGRVPLAVLAGAGLLALAVLARPPLRRPVVTLRTGGPGIALAHAATGVVVVNALLFAYSLVSPWALELVLFVFFFWIFLSVLLEYRTLRAAARRRRRARPAPEADVPPDAVTVLVAVGVDEADTLRASMEENLRLASPVTFLLVVDGQGTEETRRVARELAEANPGRVRAVETTAGSKAGDLNLAWPCIATPYLVLLDADESIDDAFIRRGYALLESRPEVAVAQGRKVARRAHENALARFVTAERRFSTWLDHPMQDEDGAAHFAGSGAMLRWGALFDVDGWNEDVLTEDIDLTLRLLLGTRWRVAYEPAMLVVESHPDGFLQLLRQRSRWARGWAQVTAAFLPRLWTGRRHLGPARSAALGWQLLASVSAPWSVLLPLLVLVRLAGVHPLFPAVVAIPLALVVLPARFLAFGYAAKTDPVTPLGRSPLRWLELLAHAYAWILFGWLTQLHALYLELAEAPRVWQTTGKHTAGSARRVAPL